MVTLNRNSARCRAAALVVFAITLSGCSLIKGSWGEASSDPGSIRANVSGESCPQASLILKGTEAESESALNCLSDQIRGVWKSVQGKAAPDSLTEQEIATLVREGVIKTLGDKEPFLRRIYSLKKLAGLGGPETPVTRQTVNAWIDWARDNRAQMRSLFHKFRLGEGRIAWSDFETGARIATEALDRMKVRMDSVELSQHLLSIFDPDDSELRAAVLPATDLAINLLNMACPTFREPDQWDSGAISKCVTQAVEQFQVGGPWTEFLFNATDELTLDKIDEIEASVKALSPRMDAWFAQPGLGKIYPVRLAELVRRMGANPPENLLESLRVIRRLKGQGGASGQSTEQAIYPEAIPFLYDNIVRPSQLNILHGLPHFIAALKKGECTNPSARYWTECMPRNLPAAASRSTEIDFASRVRNLHFGENTVAIDGERFSRIMFFRSVADVVINAFHDDQNPNFISADLKSDRDKLVELITFGVRSAEAVGQLYENIQRKLQRRPLPPRRSGIDLSVWNLSGFARLITMSSDLLVRRTPEEHNLLIGFLANFTNLFPKSRMALDRSAITAILTTVDALPDFRRSYLEITGVTEAARMEAEIAPMSTLSPMRLDETTQELLIRRSTLISKLPEILRVNFPRAFRSCEDFGFQLSCETAINALLPDAPGHEGFVHARDLDVVTIVASGLEGVIDSCDRNGDSVLSMNLLDGKDELDCGFTKTKDVIERLIDSEILKTEGGVDGGKSITAMLNFVNGTFITRITGKVAMCRGTTQLAIFNTILFPAYRHASLGSIYALIADIADTKTARSFRR